MRLRTPDGDVPLRREHGAVSEFDDLVDEAERAPIERWDFGWLDGRAVEDRPTWHYFDRVVERVAGVSTLLDIQAGVGSMIGSLPSLPRLPAATEGFAPSVAVAAPRLRSRGAHLVVTSQSVRGLPFVDGSFELVISRHPIDVWWREIARVLAPGGTYFAQHVGPHSLRSLSEFLMGPVPDASGRDSEVERRAAEAAGLVVQNMRLERPRTAFHDIGAVVYFLRLVPWIVPGFTVTKYRQPLRALHDVLERDGVFETTSSRTLIDATKPI
jgi:SAM-dependent methyltransferase